MAATKRKITKQRYYEIKKHLHTPSDDAVVMEKFGLGNTTIRDIRNTKNYDEYLARRFRYNGYPKRAKTKLNNSRKSYPADVLGLNNFAEEMAKETSGELKAPKIEATSIKPVKRQKTSLLAAAVGIFLVLCLCAVAGAATYKFLGWAFGF